MKKETVWLGLGTNVGEREQNLREALRLLEEGGLAVEAVSRVWSTPPWGIEDQPSFLNLTVRGGWVGTPEALLALALDTEARMGRERRQKWGPRLIDIDVLMFGQVRTDLPGLQLPHPWMHKRAFVLAPLCDTDPDLVVPGFRDSLATMWDELPPADKEGLEALGPLDQ